MRILIFPGMGATKEMYRKLISHHPEIIGCDWPEVTAEDDFSSLARKCIDKYEINENDIVAGCSMGGMIAAEIFVRAKCKKLMLIGSCLHPSSIPLHPFTYWGSKFLNPSLFNFFSKFVPLSVGIKSSLLSRPDFVKWSLGALHQWKGVSLLDTSNVHVIHGRIDLLIPLWKVKADHVINSGGHLIALTHPKRVAAFIKANTLFTRATDFQSS